MGAIVRWLGALFLASCTEEGNLGGNLPCTDGGVSCIAASGRACVDTARDALHCGACGNACAPGTGCVTGRCCASPACGGRCVGTRWELREAPAGREAFGYLSVDLDQDGHVDIVSVDQLDETLHVFWGDGRGTLADPSVWRVGRINGDVAAGDFDEDGTVDLVAAVQSHGPPTADTLAVMHGRPGRAAPDVTLLPEGGNPNEVAVFDADRDGHVDVLTRRSADGCLLFRPGDGEGNLLAGRCVATLLAGTDRYRAFVAVKLANRRSALVTLTPQSYELIQFGDGGEVASRASILAEATDAFGVTALDVDRDGGEDLVSIRAFPPDGTMGTDLYRLSNGASTRVGCATLGTPGMRLSLVTDFDEDGLLDLVGFRAVRDAPWVMQIYLRR